jgi:hypothetical protein
MKAKTFLLPVTLSIIFLASQAVVDLTAEAKKEKAPEFVLTTFDNKNISLFRFPGKTSRTQIHCFMVTRVPAGGSCFGEDLRENER